MATATATPDLDDAPAWAKELLRCQERIEKQLQRLSQPVDLLTAKQVAQRLAISTDAAKSKLATIFTDTRDVPSQGVERRAYSDEVTVYIAEGLRGLRRFQRETGRGIR